MRVLWLTKGLGAGGAEHLLLAVARASDPARVRYEAAYLLPWKQHLVPDLEAAGVRTHLLRGGHDLDLRWTSRLRRLLLARRVDVLHAHSPAPAALARLVVRTLPRALRPRVVTTEHNEWSSYRVGTRLLGWLTAGLDDARLAVAPEVRASLPPRLAATTEALVHGIDVAAVRGAQAERDAARLELGVADDQLLVATLANLRADKDYPNLAAAASIVLATAPDARWVVAGQGTTSPEARQLLAGPGLERLQPLGHRTDPWRILAAADVVVVASRHEGLPVVVMEALALGRPVVSTAVGGIPSLVRDRCEGRLVPSGDPAALAQAVVEVLRDQPTRVAMAAAAADRADVVDVRRAARRLEALYESLVSPQ